MWQALRLLCTHFGYDWKACKFKANVFDHCVGFMKGLREPGVAEVTCWPHLKGNPPHQAAAATCAALPM